MSKSLKLAERLRTPAAPSVFDLSARLNAYRSGCHYRDTLAAMVTMLRGGGLDVTEHEDTLARVVDDVERQRIELDEAMAAFLADAAK